MKKWQKKPQKKNKELKRKLKITLNKIEERFAIGEIDKEIFDKYSLQYKNDIEKLEQKNSKSQLSSSNLKKCLNNAMKLSSNLNEIWRKGDLNQKQKIQNIVFPDGIGYDKQSDKVQTFRVNTIFSAISSISTKLKKIKKGKTINLDNFSSRVTPAGFKPATAGAEIQCAIQLRHEPNLQLGIGFICQRPNTQQK